jgi:hypothetical protein
MDSNIKKEDIKQEEDEIKVQPILKTEEQQHENSITDEDRLLCLKMKTILIFENALSFLNKLSQTLRFPPINSEFKETANITELWKCYSKIKFKLDNQKSGKDLVLIGEGGAITKQLAKSNFNF